MNLKRLLLSLSLAGGLLLAGTTLASAAGCAQAFPTAQGGTGWCGIQATFIPYGNGTSPLATSSTFSFITTPGRLNFPYASSTAQSMSVLAVTGAGTSTVITNTIQAGCFSTNGTTCLGGGGTVTSVASSNGIIGGTITSAGTLSLQSYLATSSGETATRIPVWASTAGTPATLSGGFAGYTLTSLLLSATYASTTGITSSYASTTAQTVSSLGSAATTNVCASVTGALTISGCNNGTITTITAGTGINATTAAGVVTVGVKSYLATSTSETSGQLVAWSSTGATPATLTGGFSGYTLTSQKLTATNASTTALSIANEANIPNATATTSLTIRAGDIAENTNTASTSLLMGDSTGLLHSIYVAPSGSLTFASSSLAYIGAYSATGSTTIRVANNLYNTKIPSFFCKSDTGLAYVAFGNGSATTTAAACNTTGTNVTLSSNNLWGYRQDMFVEIGHNTSGSPNIITITAEREQLP